MKRTVRSLLLVAVLLLNLLVPAMAAGTLNETDEPVAEDISVDAYSAILLDMDTEEVLYEYNADEINYPASTTKMMTALLTLEHGDPKDMVTVSQTAMDAVPSTASVWGLVVGEKLSIHQLLQVMLVVSASDATTVAAEYVAGDIDSFVDMMNEKAEELGCTDTHFANPHGFPNSDHYTTARDLSKIALAAMEYEEFRDIVSAAVTDIDATNMSPAYTVTSTNGILPGSQYPEYEYPYAIGIKTGHTSSAGYCLASAADKDGLRLLCIVMGTPSRVSSFQQSAKLFAWGYDNYDILHYGEEPDVEPEVLEAEDVSGRDVDERTVREALKPEEDSDLEDSAEPTPAPTETPAPTVTPEPTPSAVVTEAPIPTPAAASVPAQLKAYLTDPKNRMVTVTLVGMCAVVLVLVIALVALLRKRRR